MGSVGSGSRIIVPDPDLTFLTRNSVKFMPIFKWSNSSLIT